MKVMVIALPSEDLIPKHIWNEYENDLEDLYDND